jgi:uncharacterized protein YfiM (DUF2279 family)
MFAKIFAALLTISGVFLAFGGAVAFATAKPNAPMFFAMLFAIAVFGIGCVIAALGVFRKRRYGFVLCIGLGISAAIFALYVSESVGEGILWPVFAIMTAGGIVGLLSNPRAKAEKEGAP